MVNQSYSIPHALLRENGWTITGNRFGRVISVKKGGLHCFKPLCLLEYEKVSVSCMHIKYQTAFLSVF